MRTSGEFAPRAATALALVALLAGCSIVPSFTRAGYEGADESATPSAEPSPMAALPASAGAVVAVLQSEARDVLTQRIVLKGDAGTAGENAIVVKVNESHGPWDIDGPVGLPNKAAIASELDQDFAGVDMRMSDTFERNSFGPFGYAIGHPSARVTCVYAWEFGVFKWSKLGEAPAGAPSMPVRPTSVRVRLCRSTLGEAELLPILRQLQVFSPGSRVAYVDPNYTGGEGAGDALAAAGVGYFVVPGAASPAIRVALAPEPEAPKPAHRKEARRRHARQADVEERAAAEEAPTPGSVNVPMPSGAPPAQTSNPLLAPLAAVPKAPADDMPLPGRVAATPRNGSEPPKSAFVPLPN